MRLADLVVDPSQTTQFQAAAVAHIDAAVRAEPGLLVSILCAVLVAARLLAARPRLRAPAPAR